MEGIAEGKGGQMRFIVGEGDEGEQGGGEEGPAQEEEGREPGHEAEVQVELAGEREEVGEGKAATEGGGRASVAREGEEGRDSGGEAEDDREGDRGKRRLEEEGQGCFAKVVLHCVVSHLRPTARHNQCRMTNTLVLLFEVVRRA